MDGSLLARMGFE
jgi:hypothetical protein